MKCAAFELPFEPHETYADLSLDDTEEVLRAILPPRWWIPINHVLVAFGRAVCAPVSPRCSGCPVAEACPRVGVERSR